MLNSKTVGWLMAWLVVTVFWLVTTRSFHPTFALACIVTVSLMSAYAAAIMVHQVWLIPKFWRTGRYGQYAIWLVASMLLLTGMALTVIRTSYFRMFGPDADPNGAYVHFAIDLFGMAVHMLAASAAIWSVDRFRK